LQIWHGIKPTQIHGKIQLNNYNYGEGKYGLVTYPGLVHAFGIHVDPESLGHECWVHDRVILEGLSVALSLS